jgi:hypothetical protein
MTDKDDLQHDPHGNLRKPPDPWTTGDPAMTSAQRSYLSTLCREAGIEFDERLSKAEAAMRIDELQKRTGCRPQGHPPDPATTGIPRHVDDGIAEADAHGGQIIGVSDR